MSLPDLSRYDHVLVAFSGGKDSLACLLHLLELGVAPERIELHHHDVDGGRPFMEWPCTPGYVAAVARHLGVDLYTSWREGGFHRELHRSASPTAPVRFETPGGGLGSAGGAGPLGVRGRFPQVSSDLRVRWCSAALKIDVLAASIRNQPRFKGARTIVVTGERAEESAGRARYAPLEPHRTHARFRHVDHWRPVHAWSEADVWEIIARRRITPHPAYDLGWSRLSCRACIFGGPDQWATLRAVFPESFEEIAREEAASGLTIQGRASIGELADRGAPFPAALAQLELVRRAQTSRWFGPITRSPWTLPGGAFGRTGGPT